MHQHVSHMKYRFEELDMDKHLLIDVRSPGEYAEFHHPDSVNIPLFNDDERAKVGTLYKQISQNKAKQEGVRIFSAKLNDLYAAFEELAREYPEKELILSCARGGMRSGVLVSFLRSLHMNVGQLEGGIRSIRKYVQEELRRLSAKNWEAIVLSGYTGTGKTKWLLALKEEGYPVLDLEGLANHRGSVFGHIGKQPASQKQFEWNLVQELNRYENRGVLLLEAESKRIGRVSLPDFIMETKKNGHVLEIYDDIERRIENIIEDYEPHMNHSRIEEAYSVIRKRLPEKIIREADYHLENKDYHFLFRNLLEHYYDPRYQFNQGGSSVGRFFKKVNISGVSDQDVFGVLRCTFDSWLSEHQIRQ